MKKAFWVSLALTITAYLAIFTDYTLTTYAEFYPLELPKWHHFIKAWLGLFAIMLAILGPFVIAFTYPFGDDDFNRETEGR